MTGMPSATENGRSFSPFTILSRLRDHVTGKLGLPAAGAVGARGLYGLAQPFVGLRMLLRDPTLRNQSLVPALFLSVFCAVAALLGALTSHDKGGAAAGFVRRFYHTFAVLAPLPSIVFARHYARLAAEAHRRFGFGPCEARREPLLRSAMNALKQAVLVYAGLSPLLLLEFLPLFGKLAVQGLLFLWALHWIVIDALDDSKVIRGGPTSATAASSHDRSAAVPWFARFFFAVAEKLPFGLRWLLRSFARLCGWLARPFDEEIEVMEAQPALLMGFAITTAALLATPVLNLIFRPVIILSSVHLLGELSVQQGHEVLPAAPGPTGAADLYNNA
jgi:hypothetical protein